MRHRLFWSAVAVSFFVIGISSACAKSANVGGVSGADPGRLLKTSERRAVAVSNWWKHKFKDEPAFKRPTLVATPMAAPVSMGVPGAMTVGGLKQNDVEDERS
ncbi:MAG: hypothetical protein WCG06_04950 [Candidatus Omnitrophota bacterium]